MTRKSPSAGPGGCSFCRFFPELEELRPGLAMRFLHLPAPPAACLALLELSAMAAILADPTDRRAIATLLSPAEQTRFGGLTFPKRQREWLGGRLACKAAILRLAPQPLPVAMDSLSILNAESGAPLLSWPDLTTGQPLPAVSISHSDGYAVAMATDAKCCGIDLQRITPQILRVADRFALPAEMELLRNAAPELAATDRLTLLWTAKEALKKGVLKDQPPVFEGVTLQAVNRDQAVTLLLRYPGDGGRPAAITAVALDDYFLAYTIALPHA